MASASFRGRRVDGVQSRRRSTAGVARRRGDGVEAHATGAAQKDGAWLQGKTVLRDSVHPSKVFRVKAPVRFQTRAATSAGLRCSRSKAAGRGQCQRQDRSF